MERSFLWAAVFFVVGLGGCSVGSTYGTKMSSADLGQIVKGRTTRAEVLTMFGSPTSTTSAGMHGSEVLLYHFSDSTASYNAASYIPIVSSFAGGMDSTAHSQNLLVTVSKNGIVEDYEFLDNTSGSQMRAHSPFRYSVKTY